MVGISQSLHNTALDGGSPYDGDHPVRDIKDLMVNNHMVGIRHSPCAPDFVPAGCFLFLK